MALIVEPDADTTNPTMVTLARESRGFSQSALADAMRVSQSLLSLVEGGHIPASPELLGRLAETLDYPTSFFAQRYEYRNFPVTFYRKRVRVPQRQLDEVQARINILRFRIAALLADVDIAPAKTLPMAVATARYTPSDAARELRVAWHMRPGRVPCLINLLESAGVFVVEVDFGTDTIVGTSMYQREDGLPPFIFVSRGIPGDRLRWTLAHELGHLVLHSHQPLPDEQSEKQADEFAAEFLMPAKDIRGELAGDVDLRMLASLKPSWGVSMGALLNRAKTLGVISARRAQSLWALMNKYGYKKREPVAIEIERPALVKKLLLHQMSQGGRSESWLRRTLHTNARDFSDQFASYTGRLVAVQ